MGKGGEHHRYHVLFYVMEKGVNIIDIIFYVMEMGWTSSMSYFM